MAAYTGKVKPGGTPDVRELAKLVITKVAVDDQMSNNCYVLRCRATDEQLLVDAAADAPRLLAVVGDGGLATVVTTHQHWDHHRALADVVSATGASTVAGADERPVPLARHALLISQNPATAAPRRVVTTPDGTADIARRHPVVTRIVVEAKDRRISRKRSLEELAEGLDQREIPRQRGLLEGRSLAPPVVIGQPVDSFAVEGAGEQPGGHWRIGDHSGPVAACPWNELEASVAVE